jgi:hypothetical protein
VNTGRAVNEFGAQAIYYCCSVQASKKRASVPVRQAMTFRIPNNLLALFISAMALVTLPSGNAIADDLLGLYFGGAIGQSRIEATETGCHCDISTSLITETIDEKHSAFKVMVGARPISLVGAEIAYIDFGDPSGSLFGYPANISIKGAAAFGILYLPVPIVDVYMKVGVARLESTVNGSICTPCACELQICLHSFHLKGTNTSGAAGVGIQYRFGAWGVRAEYERFNAAGSNPGLLSAGVTWSFF